MLKNLLYSLKAARTIYQHFHWNSAGQNYYADHLLFERIGNELLSQIDGLAEKILGVGGEIGPIQDVECVEVIVKKFVSDDLKPNDFPVKALELEKYIISVVEEIMKGDNSDGVENMVQGIADKREEAIYLLQQRNKSAAIIYKLTKMANELDLAGHTSLADLIDTTIVSIASRSQQEIDKEKDMVLRQIERLETSNEPEIDQETLSFLREKYKSLALEMPDEEKSIKIKDIIE